MTYKGTNAENAEKVAFANITDKGIFVKIAEEEGFVLME